MNTSDTNFEPLPGRAGSPRPRRWTLAEVQEDPHKLRLMTTIELAHTVHAAENEDDDVTCIAVAQMLAVRGNLAERVFHAAYMELWPQYSENDKAVPTEGGEK